MSYNLFLDDIREPVQVGNYMLPVELRSLYRLKQWAIVRNYDEFARIIQLFGLPDLISFDHDLADEHYTPEEYWHDYDISKTYQDAREYTERTGLDCAKFLVEYCIHEGLKIPEYHVHSANPVGADNIRNYIENYKKHHETKTTI